MAWWSCNYCTLINHPSANLCAACGSQNPAYGAPSNSRTQRSRLMLKLPKLSMNGALNAIDSALTSAGLLPSAFSSGPATSPPQHPSSSHPSSKWYTSIFDRLTAPISPSSQNAHTPRSPPNVSPTSAQPMRVARPLKPVSLRRTPKPRSLSHPRIVEHSRSSSAPTFPTSPSTSALNNNNTNKNRSQPSKTNQGQQNDSPTSRFVSSSSIHLEKKDVQDASSNFQRITQFCKHNNLPFIDDSFPQCVKSIGDLSPQNDGTNKPRVNPNELIWLRPQNMFTKDGRRYAWSVFRDPRPTDIEQGSLGNCWFLSSLAVIAERPDILEQIVLTKVYNPFGIYQIRLCVDGRWQVVIVDDFFPCNARTRGLAFAVGRRNQLWVPLIEKAFAKISGSYGKLLAGRTIEGLAVLTGAPCSQIDLESATTPDARQMLWASLLSMREARFVMGCSCGAGKRFVNDAEYKAVGLQPRHAYSLLDITEYNGHRLVRLRNPWGTFVWNREWSDLWSGWTPAARAALLPNGPEAGTFWIPFKKFVQHFDTVDVAKVRNVFGWKELRIDCTLQASWGRSYITGIRIITQRPTEVAFTLYQNGSRQRTETDIMLLVHRRGPPNSAIGELFTRSARKIAPFVSTGDVFLNGPGEYMILPLSFSNVCTATRIKLVVAAHSAHPLMAEKVRFPASVATESLIEVALKEGTLHKALEGVVARYITDNFSGHLLVIDNLHEDKYLQVHCDCSKSSNVLSTRFTFNTVDSIPPLHRQLIMMLNHFEPTQGYYVGHSLTQRIVSFRGLRDWVSLVPGRISLPASTEHIPPLNEPAVAVLHRPTPLYK